MLFRSTKIDEDIYIFKDIISKEDAEKILNVCTNLQQGQWNLPWSGNTGDYNWIWSNRFATTETLESINSNISHEWKEIMNNVKKTIFNFLKKEYDVNGFGYILRARMNDKMEIHIDNNEDKNIKYGVILYFNDNYDGGEVFYSDLNKSIKPEARSLILHRADIHHGVREVTKGIRYYATAFLLEI